MLPRIDFCSTDAYKALLKHFEQIKKENLRNLFKDQTRFEQFSISFGDILLDYSKNRINSHTHDLLLQLAEECGLKEAIKQQFNGEIINETEGRAVLHTALRNPKRTGFILDGKDILPDIHRVLEHGKDIAANLLPILLILALGVLISVR